MGAGGSSAVASLFEKASAMSENMAPTFEVAEGFARKAETEASISGKASTMFEEIAPIAEVTVGLVSRAELMESRS